MIITLIKAIAYYEAPRHTSDSPYLPVGSEAGTHTETEIG